MQNALAFARSLLSALKPACAIAQIHALLTKTVVKHLLLMYAKLQPDRL